MGMTSAYVGPLRPCEPTGTWPWKMKAPMVADTARELQRWADGFGLAEVGHCQDGDATFLPVLWLNSRQRRMMVAQPEVYEVDTVELEWRMRR